MQYTVDPASTYPLVSVTLFDDAGANVGQYNFDMRDVPPENYAQAIEDKAKESFKEWKARQDAEIAKKAEDDLKRSSFDSAVKAFVVPQVVTAEEFLTAAPISLEVPVVPIEKPVEAPIEPPVDTPVEIMP